jgi:hypothetical protein
MMSNEETIEMLDYYSRGPLSKGLALAQNAMNELEGAVDQEGGDAARMWLAICDFLGHASRTAEETSCQMRRPPP